MMSRLYRRSLAKENKEAILFTRNNGLDILDAFESSISSKEDIVSAGQRFLLKLYGARSRSAGIFDKLRYIAIFRQPAATKQHSSNRTAVEMVNLTESEVAHSWQHSIVSVETDISVAADCLLKLMSCGFKSGCSKACGCLKLELHCTPRCTAGVKAKPVHVGTLPIFIMMNQFERNVEHCL